MHTLLTLAVLVIPFVILWAVVWMAVVGLGTR
jgi:hypothetical protein